MLEALTAEPGAPLRLAVLAPAGHGKSTLLRAVRERWPEATGDVDAATAGAPLVVDDAHLATPERIAAIGALLEQGAPRVVLAARPWPCPPALSAVLATLTDPRPVLTLPALTVQRTARFAAAITGAAPSATTARFLHTCTGGVPRFLERVLAPADAEGIERMAAQRRIPREAVEPFRADLDGLDERVARLLIAADAGAGNDLVLLGEVLDADRDTLAELVESARAAALLRPDGTVAPVVGLAIRALGPVDRRAGTVQRLVEALGRAGKPVLGAASTLLGSGAGGTGVASAFECAAREAVDSDPALATRLFGAAADAGRPVTSMAPGWARAAALAGDLDTALRLSDALLGDRDPELRAEGAGISATVLAHRGELARSAELFQWSGIGGARAFAAVGLAGTGRPEAARSLLASPGEPAMPTLLAGAAQRMAEGVADSLTGAPATALPPLTSAAAMLEPAGATTLMPDSPAALAALAALHAGQLTLADSVLTRAVGNGAGGRLLAGRHRLLRAWVAMTRGELPDAAAIVREVADGGRTLEPRDELFRRALEVGLARRSSDIAGMRRVWQQAYEALMRHQVDLFMLLPLGELMIAAARLGEHDSLDRHAAQASELLSTLGDPPLWTPMVSWSRLQAAVTTQDGDQAGVQAETLGRFAGLSPFTTALAEAAASWHAVLAGSPDAEQVCAAAGQLHELGLRWDAARLAGQAAIRTSDRAAMVMLLDAARRFHGVARQPRQVPSGEDPGPEPAQQQTGVADASALSDREQEVAALVLDGMTYKQVGARLFISAKTVEHHMARMRGKLGAANRRELLGMLRELLGENARPTA
ncbi:helix-turn-helix transcriptional regulator [Amycolatopsis antarctica]|uniref:Helix-turn-helix transcriptional regulator n=1 Tax=Amycolatopsis antarctica TaxID=1854586 RepID=A0A263D1T6_9PSEU|nr:helix-turn-helix transcriptional regulator [Amycolatopsis antarctica]